MHRPIGDEILGQKVNWAHICGLWNNLLTGRGFFINPSQQNTKEPTYPSNLSLFKLIFLVLDSSLPLCPSCVLHLSNFVCFCLLAPSNDIEVLIIQCDNDMHVEDLMILSWWEHRLLGQHSIWLACKSSTSSQASVEITIVLFPLNLCLWEWLWLQW